MLFIESCSSRGPTQQRMPTCPARIRQSTLPVVLSLGLVRRRLLVLRESPLRPARAHLATYLVRSPRATTPGSDDRRQTRARPELAYVRRRQLPQSPRGSATARADVGARAALTSQARSLHARGVVWESRSTGAWRVAWGWDGHGRRGGLLPPHVSHQVAVSAGGARGSPDTSRHGCRAAGGHRGAPEDVG